MLGRVITITSGKGGVGKTTTTANLGVALAQTGLKVAVVDADIGLRNLDVMMGLENRVVYNLMHVIGGACPADRALIRDKRVPGLHLLAADQHTDKDEVSPQQMIEVCEALREEMDIVLIDSPAGIEQGFRNALAPADELVLVTTPEVTAVRDGDRVIGLAEAAGKPTPRLILNRLKPNLIARGDMLDADDVLEVLRVELLGVVPEDERILVAGNRGEPVAMTNHSPAGHAFQVIARRMLGQPAPEPSLANGSILERLAGLFRLPEGAWR
jgi:septum site-determining protein MinD